MPEWKEAKRRSSRIKEGCLLSINRYACSVVTTTGVVVQRDDFPTFRDSINSIKYAFWKDSLTNTN